jgi:hypothetical protein
LVGTHDDATDAAYVVERLHGDDHLRGRAVGAGDDAFVIANRVRVDLRNDQRHVGIHPPVPAFVDDDATALDGPGSEIAGDLVGRAADGEIHAVERFGFELFDRVFAA